MNVEKSLSLDEATNLFLHNIESKVSTALYNAWFKNLQILDLDSSALLYIDSDFKKKMILDNQNYKNIIEEALKDVTGKDYDFELQTNNISNEFMNANYEDKSSLTPTFDTIKNEIIDNSVNNIEDINKENININNNLLPEYTFDNYMVSNINRVVQAQALMVAKNPGNSFNPFFIYGNSGIGKTHLMMAIGNYIVQNSNKTVLYVSSSNFRDEYTTAIRNSNNSDYTLLDHFKYKYRNIDVLIIDDIQMIAEAKQTQNQLFDIIDQLYRDKKQIIISSDQPPAKMTKFDNRLITRFGGGLALSINPPDKDLKIKILKNETLNTILYTMMDDSVYEYIAENSPSDARSLKGAINTLLVNATMWSPPKIDIEFARNALGSVFDSTQYITNNLLRIRKTVAEYYDVTEESLKSKKRTANINKARQVAWYISSIVTEETITRIGLEYNRDHATVLHGVEKIRNDLTEDKELEREIKEIKDRLIE